MGRRASQLALAEGHGEGFDPAPVDGKNDQPLEVYIPPAAPARVADRARPNVPYRADLLLDDVGPRHLLAFELAVERLAELGGIGTEAARGVIVNEFRFGNMPGFIYVRGGPWLELAGSLNFDASRPASEWGALMVLAVEIVGLAHELRKDALDLKRSLRKRTPTENGQLQRALVAAGCWLERNSPPQDQRDLGDIVERALRAVGLHRKPDMLKLYVDVVLEGHEASKSLKLRRT